MMQWTVDNGGGASGRSIAYLTRFESKVLPEKRLSQSISICRVNGVDIVVMDGLLHEG